MVRAARIKVKLNKPIAVGFTILEISKHIMCDFFYGYLNAKYQERCSLLFTDTDSLCCEIQTEDLYRDMGENLKSCSTRATSRWDILSIPLQTAASWQSSKAKPAHNRPENLSFCVQRCTVLMYRVIWQSHRKKPKAFKDTVWKNMYATASFSRFCVQVYKFHIFRSTNHVINTVEMTKLCLCAFDDKRYILDNGIHTLAYGHYSLQMPACGLGSHAVERASTSPTSKWFVPRATQSACCHV